MTKEHWEAHCKFVREVILPAALKAARERPMTEADRKSAEEYKRIFDRSGKPSRPVMSRGEIKAAKNRNCIKSNRARM